MTRKQILYDGCFGHIYSRALGHKRIFRSDRDFAIFKGFLKEHKARYGYRVHHYCLMHTHFHLLISMDSVENLSRGMKELKRLYANRIHKEHREYGPVWWGRYGSQLIEDERYLSACGLYIENNPIKAGMVERAEDWMHSSSRHYFLGEEDALVDPYDRPGAHETLELMKDLNLEKGYVIGSELFRIHVEEDGLVTFG